MKHLQQAKGKHKLTSSLIPWAAISFRYPIHFHGHGPLMKRTTEVFLLWDKWAASRVRRAEVSRQDCQVGTVALWIQCCWEVPWAQPGWAEGHPHWAPLAIEGTDGSAVPHCTQARCIHLPKRDAKENTQSCYVKKTLGHERPHSKASQYENTQKSWDKLKKAMHKREGLISMCEDYLSQKSVCYRLILLQLTTHCCQLAFPRNFTRCLKFLR